MQPYYTPRQQLRREALQVATNALRPASPFPFPTADHNPFTGASQSEYDTARRQLDQAYQDARDLLSQQWQIAVNRYQADQPDNTPPDAA